MISESICLNSEHEFIFPAYEFMIHKSDLGNHNIMKYKFVIKMYEFRIQHTQFLIHNYEL